MNASSSSRLKLVKTRLRNGLSNATLEQILHIALNGPELQEFIDSGMMKRALSFFFSMKNRNAKPPPGYIDHFLKQQLQRLVWGTHCNFPPTAGVTPEDLARDRHKAWPLEECGEDVDLDQAIDAAMAVLDSEHAAEEGD